jgi:cyanophycin synthetase
MPADTPQFRSAHARYAAHTAAVCDYRFRSLDGEDGYLFEVGDDCRRGLFAAGAGTPYALNDARAAAIARDKAFSAEVLRQAGVPVLPGRMYFVTTRWAEMRGPGREPEDALAYAATAEYPLFCKPLAASNGLYAEVIDDAAEFSAYMRRVAREHFAILVQPYIRAPEHRVFVLNGAALFSYRKTPPAVVGDGERDLAALVRALPREAEAPPLKPSGRDSHGAKVGASAVPPRGALIVLDGPANRAAGGRSEALTDGAPPPLAQVAVEAANAIGLSLAAVDVFDVAGDFSRLCVIEVNSNPMIATLEDHGRWDLIEAIWKMNFAAALR